MGLPPADIVPTQGCSRTRLATLPTKMGTEASKGPRRSRHEEEHTSHFSSYRAVMGTHELERRKKMKRQVHRVPPHKYLRLTTHQAPSPHPTPPKAWSNNTNSICISFLLVHRLQSLGASTSPSWLHTGKSKHGPESCPPRQTLSASDYSVLVRKKSMIRVLCIYQHHPNNSG